MIMSLVSLTALKGCLIVVHAFASLDIFQLLLQFEMRDYSEPKCIREQESPIHYKCFICTSQSSTQLRMGLHRSSLTKTVLVTCLSHMSTRETSAAYGRGSID